MPSTDEDANAQGVAAVLGAPPNYHAHFVKNKVSARAAVPGSMPAMNKDLQQLDARSRSMKAGPGNVKIQMRQCNALGRSRKPPAISSSMQRKILQSIDPSQPEDSLYVYEDRIGED